MDFTSVVQSIQGRYLYLNIVYHVVGLYYVGMFKRMRYGLMLGLSHGFSHIYELYLHVSVLVFNTSVEKLSISLFFPCLLIDLQHLNLFNIYI